MSGTKKDATALVIGGPPRIDFLPLEVKQRKENRKSRRSLITLVIVVPYMVWTARSEKES